MPEIAIQVENLGKQYRLGQIGTGTFRDDLNRFWAKMRGKEDPTLIIGQTNTLATPSSSAKDKSGVGKQDQKSKIKDQKSDYVWALRDINFSVEQGEVLGIIGKNGAGKSTLLKILSKVTAPTTGNIKIKGRIASLLEVGTGFHPELSGRDNIFLNGAILGMTKAEIRSKFDEIVDFSGVGNYIDTPVKRYSSGMYVRLAFAVAAHLEPEILIVDEVLAVGDVEFQKKALGKMQDVSKSEGRTVLFVSHNMNAIQGLCKNAILLKEGLIAKHDDCSSVINFYLRENQKNILRQEWNDISLTPGNDNIKILSAAINPLYENENNIITIHTPLIIEFEFLSNFLVELLNLSMNLYNIAGDIIFNTISEIVEVKKGCFKGVCEIPGDLLNNGLFSISIMVVKEKSIPLFFMKEVLVFEVHDDRKDENWFGDMSHHLIRPKLQWAFGNI